MDKIEIVNANGSMIGCIIDGKLFEYKPELKKLVEVTDKEENGKK